MCIRDSPTSGVLDLTSVPTITNAKLQNSAMTLAGSSVSLGGTGVANTDALSEGSSNLYFTNARVQSFLGGGTLAGNVVVPDNRSIYLGSSSDFRLVHNTTNTQLINATGSSSDGVAYFAHIGGFVFGYIAIKYFFRGTKARIYADFEEVEERDIPFFRKNRTSGLRKKDDD